MITNEEILRMSDAEVAALNKKLAQKVMTRFALFFLIKWAVLVALNLFSRKLRKSDTNV